MRHFKKKICVRVIWDFNKLHSIGMNTSTLRMCMLVSLCTLVQYEYYSKLSTVFDRWCYLIGASYSR